MDIITPALAKCIGRLKSGIVHMEAINRGRKKSLMITVYWVVINVWVLQHWNWIR